MRYRWLTLLLLTNLALPPLVAADEASWDLAGSVELQTRLFTQNARWPGQASQSAMLSVAASVDLRWRYGNQRASLIPYGRWDGVDDERSIIDLREAYWAYEGDNVEWLVGANTVFWGVTESVHLVDIINQTDAVADIDGEDKLGQPMVNLALQRDWGQLDFFLMPYFRERPFTGVDGRLRTPLPVDTGKPQYESASAEHHLDAAIRYSHYFGDVDLGLSYFHGTSREPRLLPSANGLSLLPYYDQIDQFGVDLQYTRNAWLWKLETIVRNGFSETFSAAVAGFEYTFYQIRGTAADVGVLVEYQYDGRGQSEPFTVADNDIFVGARLALNDTQDTTILAGAVYDHDTGEVLFNVEAERRFGDSVVLELRARAFTGSDVTDSSFAVVSDDYVQLQIGKYF